jgi:YVTN family beta-propeller protein
VKEELVRTQLAISTAFLTFAAPALAGQAPLPASAPDVPVSDRDRVYVAEQYSNTVSVIDPSSNRNLGVIQLGDAQPAALSPLYKGQLLVHGLGFSPDHRTLAVVSVGSNSVTFVDTATNTVKHVTYLGRSPHEAFFTPDGSEVWVSVRGEDYVSVLDGTTYTEKDRVRVPNGPGMVIFSPDGRYGFVCSSFSPETVAIKTRDLQIVGRMKQESPFCPNIAASPDGQQVWLTLKDVGRVMAFEAKPPFRHLRTLSPGPLTNHVNFARTKKGQLAYVSVGGLNQVQVYRTSDFELVATIPTGDLPHGLWPSGDGTRMYVALENADAVAAIDTAAQKVVAVIPGGHAGQALVYVPRAVPGGGSAQNLKPLSSVATATHLRLDPVQGEGPGTTVALFDQGLTQVIQAAAAGLEPKKPYVLLLSDRPDGTGEQEPIARFMANPAGAAVVNAVGPIRQLVQPRETSQATPRRYLAIAAVGSEGTLGPPVQVQATAAPPTGTTQGTGASQ